MKRKSIRIILEIAFLCLSLGNPLTALCQSETSKDKLPVVLEVLNPRGEIPPVQATGLTPRLKDLNGKKIGLIDNGKAGAGYFLDAVEEELKKNLPSVTVVRFKKPGSTTAASPKFYPKVAKRLDAFIYATGDWGSCTWWGSHDASQIERNGRPGVFVVTENLLRDATSAAQDNGMPPLRIVSVPSEDYYKARTSVKEMRPIAAGTVKTIIDALTRPLTQEEIKPKPISQQAPERTLRISAEDYGSAYEKFNQLFLDNRWGDGLPIVPPTTETVKWMLKGTSRSPDEVIGNVAVKNGTATIEKIAINAVMAGAKPEYLPVIIAAMEALTDKDYDLKHLQTSTGSITPVIIVNGPITKELNINSGIGYLGHGWRANSTIGRAVRLCLINLGHMWPQANDMALTGREAAFGNFTFAENEVDSPWKPYHADLGFKPGESTVTVSSTMWHLRQGPGGAVTVHTPKEALKILAKMLVEINYPTPPASLTWLPSKNYIIALDPGLARGFSEIGFSKENLKRWFFENARVPFSTLSQREINDLEGAILGRQLPAHVLTKDQLKEGGMVPVFSAPEHIHIIVVGGMPGYAGIWCYPGPRSGHQTKRIRGATLTNSGR